jgi:hypothetical protein
MIRVEEHPDRQPGRPIAVNSGDDDDRESDENFEGKRIYLGTPPVNPEKSCNPVK